MLAVITPRLVPMRTQFPKKSEPTEAIDRLRMQRVFNRAMETVMPQDSAQRQVPIQDFLNPNSMLTPGMAGGMTMLITNALCQHFPLPNDLTGLGLSFLFGLLVFVATGPMWQRSVYYLLNSLVIFCVAAGASGFGASVTDTNEDTLSSLIVRPAIAQETSAENPDTLEALMKQNAALQNQIDELRKQLQSMRRAQSMPRTRGLAAPVRPRVMAAPSTALRPATTRPAMTKVPRLVNQDYRAAARQLNRAGLRIGKVRRRTSSKSSGTILRQSPPAGTNVRPGTTVHIDVATSKKFFRKWF